MAIPVPQFFSGCFAPFRRAFGACSRSRSAAARSIWARGGADKEKPQQVAEKPTDNISARSVSDAQGYATRGQVLAKSGKTEEALAEFDRALALDPYNAQALYGRGLIYQGEKQHQQAIEDFTAANGLTPQQAEPLLGRAVSYLALDKAKEAAADLDEAVQADPNSAPAWSARGLAYERLGDKTKAAASYGRAINLRPKDEAARSGFARVGGQVARLFPPDAISAGRRGTPTSPPTARLRRPTYARALDGSVTSARRSSGRRKRDVGRRRRAARIDCRIGRVRRPRLRTLIERLCRPGVETMIGGGSGRSAGAVATRGARLPAQRRPGSRGLGGTRRIVTGPAQPLDRGAREIVGVAALVRHGSGLNRRRRTRTATAGVAGN